MVGRDGNDEIYGQPAGDSLSGSEVDNDLYGGSGDDAPRDGPGQDDLYGGGTDGLIGGDGIDELSGGNNDTINALSGGRDSIDCGLGNDDRVIADEVDGVNISDRERITER